MLALGAGWAARATAASVPRVAVLDWGLAETLLALGIAPVAAAELRGYARWVREPAMPPGVLDVGLRAEPHLEALERIAPELILSTPQFAPFRPRLERVAPVASFATYMPGGDPLARSREVAMDLARRLGCEPAARALLQRGDAALDAAAAPGDAPLLVATFMDARHLRVFGANSLFGATLVRLGRRNGWTGPTNHWGFAAVPVERLAVAPAARLVVVGPLPPAVAGRLDRNPLWRALPAVRAGRVAMLPPCWAFGGVPSALRFARLLADV
jgi:iron complex transport system substrate-binding protein